jgi:hypothetical protein
MVVEGAQLVHPRRAEPDEGQRAKLTAQLLLRTTRCNAADLSEMAVCMPRHA